MKDKQGRVVKLPAAELKAHLTIKPQVTQAITIINSGADDKFEFVLVADVEGGGSGMWFLLKDMPQQGRADIPLSQLGFQFVNFHLRWRDKNGIGRYTPASKAAPKNFYLNMTCWWLAESRDPTIEEALLYGNEIPL